MRVSIKVGEFNVSSSEGDFRECMAELDFLLQAPKICPVCECALNLYFRNVKSGKDGKRYRYFGLRCTNPIPDDQHEKAFGQFEDGSGLFYKWNNEESPWVRVGDVRGNRAQDDGDMHEPPPQEQRSYANQRPASAQTRPNLQPVPPSPQRHSQYSTRGN